MITEIPSIQNSLKPLNKVDMILSFQNKHMLQSDNSRFVSHRKCSAMMNNMSCIYFYPNHAGNVQWLRTDKGRYCPP